MLEAMTMYNMLLPASWAFLAVYIAWFLTSAKRYAPLTKHEVRALWRIHRRNTKCQARHWKEIFHKSKLVGFKCECGYTHAQKRPIV